MQSTLWLCFYFFLGAVIAARLCPEPLKWTKRMWGRAQEDALRKSFTGRAII
jgi:hypothetical protein